MSRGDQIEETGLSTRDLADGRDAGSEPGVVDDGSAEPRAAQAEANAQVEAGRDAAGRDGDESMQESLLPADQTDRFSARWQEIQSTFVDRPRQSVEEADALVADLMQRLAAGFSNERERLESQWEGGADVSTEELRVALTRYRSFFDRLLSA